MFETSMFETSMFKTSMFKTDMFETDIFSYRYSSGETAMFDLSPASFPMAATHLDTLHARQDANPSDGIELQLQRLGLPRKLVHRKDTLFRAGQSTSALYLVRSGYFKMSVLSEDGREKITGFRMRGDLLGLDSLGMPNHGCEAVALDVGEVLELPCSLLSARLPEFQSWLTTRMACEIRRDWEWMLATSTLGAEQRVVAFLLDLADRQRALGYSAEQVMLHMTRAEIGNFLGLQLETVTRALSHLDAIGAIEVDRREIRIFDLDGLRAIIVAQRGLH
jgi:CRP/FNR family transcriptional regulator, anaerobic regulatory protein